MKKLLGISLVALLAVSPMMASAADVNKDPVNIANANPAQTAADVTPDENHQPKYALKQEGANDLKPATAGYVKGAYNAAIKGINAIHDNYIELKDDYDEAFDDYAKSKDVHDALDEAKAIVAIDDASITSVNSITKTGATVTATASVPVSFFPVDDWENDALASTATSAVAELNVDVSQNVTLAVGANTSATAAEFSKTGVELDVGFNTYPIGG